ncbi:hypothetical protein C8R47DRAFT_749071 [Mycena vitilis]|nr:hypothetical protein C8R47DRAFT_749071 [Mycena vitilis]
MIYDDTSVITLMPVQRGPSFSAPVASALDRLSTVGCRPSTFTLTLFPFYGVTALFRCPHPSHSLIQNADLVLPPQGRPGESLALPNNPAMGAIFGDASHRLSPAFARDRRDGPHSMYAVVTGEDGPKPTESVLSMKRGLRLDQVDGILPRRIDRPLPVDPSSGPSSIFNSQFAQSSSTSSSAHITAPSSLSSTVTSSLTTTKPTSTTVTSTTRPPPPPPRSPPRSAPPADATSHATASPRQSSTPSTSQPTHSSTTSSVALPSPDVSSDTLASASSSISASTSTPSSIPLSASATKGKILPALVGTLVPVLVIVLFAVVFVLHRRRHARLVKQLEERRARPPDEDWQRAWLRQASARVSAAPWTPQSGGRDTHWGGSDVLILGPGEKARGRGASISSSEGPATADIYGSAGMDSSWNGSHIHLLRPEERLTSAFTRSVSPSPRPSPIPPSPVSEGSEEGSEADDHFPPSPATATGTRTLSRAPTFTTFASGRTPPTPLPVYIRALPTPRFVRPLPTPGARRPLPMPRPMPIRPLPKLPFSRQ